MRRTSRYVEMAAITCHHGVSMWTEMRWWLTLFVFAFLLKAVEWQSISFMKMSFFIKVQMMLQFQSHLYLQMLRLFENKQQWHAKQLVTLTHFLAKTNFSRGYGGVVQKTYGNSEGVGGFYSKNGNSGEEGTPAWNSLSPCMIFELFWINPAKTQIWNNTLSSLCITRLIIFSSHLTFFCV